MKEALISALLASGFKQFAINDTDYDTLLLPCPVGTFSNSSAKGQRGCTQCPPGIMCASLHSVRILCLNLPL